MRKPFTFILVSIMLFTLVACSNPNINQTDVGESLTKKPSLPLNTDRETPEPAAPTTYPTTPTTAPIATPPLLPTTFAIGDTLIFPDKFEIKMTQMEFTSRVDPPHPDSFYSYYEVKDSDKVYIHSVFEVKNLKANELMADDILSVSILYDDKYSYTGFSTFEEDGGGDFNYTSISSIAPLTVGIIHFITEVPVEVRDSGKNVSLSLNADNKSITCTGDTDTPQILAFGDISTETTAGINTNWQKYPTLEYSQTIVEDDFAEMTLIKAEFSNIVKPTNASGYYSYYEVKDAAKTYAHIVIAFKNLQTNSSAADRMAHIELVYDNKYSYSGFATIEEDGGRDFTYTSITNIAPLDMGTIHYLVEVPLEVRDSEKTLAVIVTFNKASYSFKLGN